MLKTRNIIQKADLHFQVMKYSACYILIRSPAQSNINHLSCNTQTAYKSVSTRQACVPLFETLLQTIDLLKNTAAN